MIQVIRLPLEVRIKVRPIDDLKGGPEWKT